MADGCLGTETLSDFLEGRAELAVRARVEQHASRCDDCRRLLSSLARDGTPLRHPLSFPSRTGALVPGAQVGRYVIDRELGTGGMGVVYAAHDPELGRTVAVKVLRRDGDHSMQTRLRREAQTMARLAHPNVVTVHDVGVFGDSIFLAMEYIEGETLARWLLAPRAPGAVLEVLRAAGRGLAAAHALGIVHRDFKPENVLVGSDGRVCVGDFGLARTAGAGQSSEAGEAGPAPVTRPVIPGAARAASSATAVSATAWSYPAAASSSPTMLAGLTVPGSLVGTPYYMAPELYAGAPADERSDQFSFCVTLLTALHGARAGEAATLDPVARAGRFRTLAATLPMRRRVRAALLRGLALDPAARFGSLDALLDALAPHDGRLRGAFAAGAALLVGMVAIAWVYAGSSAEPDQRCTGAAAAYATTWSPQRRGAVEAAFTATHAPFAAASLRQVTAALDRYGARWTSAHTATCRATRILGEQAESTLDLRMTCLERRRQEAAALIDTLAAADLRVVIRSVEATAGLLDVAMCADVATLRQIVAPPVDAVTRARLAALTPQLALARAKLKTGAYAAGLAIVRPIAVEARALGYRPFEAEAAIIQGELLAELGDRTHAEATLEAAVLAAEAGRHDEIAARARSRLVFIVGADKAEYARALALAPFATAAIARLGGNAEIEAVLENALGSIDMSQSKLPSAIVHFERALALEERTFGADHPGAAQIRNGLGVALLKQGNTDRAAVLFQRAMATFERVLGPDHPLVAQELCMLGAAHVTLGNPVLGEQEIRRALAIRQAAFGAEHPDVVTNMSFLASALRALGRDQEALKLLLQITPVAEHAWGAEHPIFAKILLNLAVSLGDAGRYAEAGDVLHRAEAIFTKLYGPDHVMVTWVHTVFAGMQIAQSRWREAAALYERAIPVFEAAEEADDGPQEARVKLALAYLELHQPARALAVLEPLTHHVDRQPWQWRGDIRFMLARALWDSGRDRKQAHELATVARPDLVRAAKARELAKLDRWLASHPVRQGADLQIWGTREVLRGTGNAPRAPWQ